MRARQVLADAKVVSGKISAGMVSKDLDELAEALESASEAKLSNEPDVVKARTLYNELKATSDEFSRALEVSESQALEPQVFDAMRAAYEKAAQSGVSGAAHKRNFDQYMEYVNKNNRANDTALFESRAKLEKYQKSCNLEGLRGAMTELHGLTGDSIDQWNTRYAGTKLEKNTASFEQYFAAYTKAKQLVEQLSAIVQELVTAMQIGAVKAIERIISQPLLKPETGGLPPIKEVEEANVFLGQVADFSRRLQKACASKDVDTLRLLFEEAKTELNQAEDAKDILTDEIRSQYASWANVTQKLTPNGVAWMENPIEFLEAVKKAQDMNILSESFAIALDNAQKFVTMGLQLAFSQLREVDLASARDCERKLSQAVEYATILADSNLYGRQIGESHPSFTHLFYLKIHSHFQNIQ